MLFDLTSRNRRNYSLNFVPAISFIYDAFSAFVPSNYFHKIVLSMEENFAVSTPRAHSSDVNNFKSV